MDGAADVAETTYTPFQTKPGAAPVRLIVPGEAAPVPNWPSYYSYHGFITDRDGETLELEADHDAEIEVDLTASEPHAVRPFAANGAWLAVQVMAHKPAGRRGSVWVSRW